MPVRVAKHGDLAAIMDVEQASFPPLDQWSCTSWQADLDAPDRHVIVMDVDRHGAGATDEASAHGGAGSGLVAVATFHAVADTCDLDRIMVTPQQRRRGLAGALLDDGLGWARSQGCTRILLEVRDDNTTAQQLYRSRGFDVLSRRPHYYRSTAGEPAADALIMAVSLTSPLLMPPGQHCSHTTRPARLPQQDGRPRQQVNDARRQPGCSETSHQAGQTGTNAHEENHV
ncbi:MAG: GNAT family N-acetyltransferase [Cutibacterium granulosum]|nr:GNAT family N-acetyltransferase [Cutibacterium granulosum]MDU3822016.1 GNAT family N-acetyltransferase [Cutibacterium granulosum]